MTDEKYQDMVLGERSGRKSTKRLNKSSGVSEIDLPL